MCVCVYMYIGIREASYPILHPLCVYVCVISFSEFWLLAPAVLTFLEANFDLQWNLAFRAR